MSITRFAIFIGVSTAIVFGIHYFLWARLVRDLALSPAWSGCGTLALALLGTSLPLGMAAGRVLPRGVATPVAFVVFTWMGIMFFLLVALLPFEIVRLAAASKLDPDRRITLARGLAGLAGLFAAGAGTVGVVSVLSPISVKRVRVPLARLPRALSGYTIVQLSDIHVGPTIGKTFIEELVATVNREKPDLVAITGDLADGSVEALGPLVAPLRYLQAKDGVFFVTGNHEYYSGVDEWLKHIGELGIRVLRNERVAIGDASHEGAGGFDLAGVDDASAHQFGGDHGMDVERALAGRDPTRAVVLLAHQPKAIHRAARLGVDLQLSGHTHGGQIWPWNYAVKLDQPHVAGLADHRGTAIYVSNGTGYWGPPMRVGAPAEVTRIELVASG